jgi:hypothetical protein
MSFLLATIGFGLLGALLITIARMFSEARKQKEINDQIYREYMAMYDTAPHEDDSEEMGVMG